jgi:hypothetical protein
MEVAMSLPLPWIEVTPEAARALEAELAREVGGRHPLWGCRATALARRSDRDDVLFAIEGETQVALVHLSYAGPSESPDWPAVTFHASVQAAVNAPD